MALAYWRATGSTALIVQDGLRLLRGLEYTAKYNLNHTVPFAPNCDVYNISCFKEISAQDRGRFAPLWEMAAAVYSNSPLLDYVKRVVGKPGYRPEGKPPPIIHGGAHVGDGPPGLGTLTFLGMEAPAL